MPVTNLKTRAKKASADLPDFEHTGPGTLAGAFLRSGWQPILRSEDIAKGRAKPIRVLSEDFTLYRGESGALHLIGQRCAHRGTQLSAGWVEGDEIRCLYHGWKYDGTGQCTEMPAESAAYAAKVKIASYPVREHVGLVFGCFGEGEPPPFPHIPAFEGEGVLHTSVEYFPCNFFQCWENSFDEYHVHFTHRTGGMHPKFPQLPEMVFEETDYGIRRTMTTADGRKKVSPFFMPNVLRTTVPSPNALQGHGPVERDSYLIKVPVDDESHVFFIAQHAAVPQAEQPRYMENVKRYLEQRANARPPYELGLEILAGRLTLLDVKDHPYLAVIEDVVAQGGQGRIADRAAEKLGRSDAGIVAMRRIWAREMKAIAEGKPAKRWCYKPGTPF